jgi:16S rRNA processing protein RimM
MQDQSRKIDIKQEEMIYVGVVKDAYHMQGLVKIKTFTEDPNGICDLKCLDSTGKNYKISSSKIKGVYKIAGIENRTEAENLIGVKFYVHKADLPMLADDSFYVKDLINLPVIDFENNLIGYVKGCMNFGAGDLIEIAFLNDKVEIYPFTKDIFIEVCDMNVKMSNKVM